MYTYSPTPIYKYKDGLLLLLLNTWMALTPVRALGWYKRWRWRWEWFITAYAVWAVIIMAVGVEIWLTAVEEVRDLRRHQPSWRRHPQPRQRPWPHSWKYKCLLNIITICSICKHQTSQMTSMNVQFLVWLSSRIPPVKLGISCSQKYA